METKVFYFTHAELNDVPKEVRRIWNEGYPIDKIVYDPISRLFKIDYYEVCFNKDNL